MLVNKEVHAESATGICGLLPYTCGLMSSWAFVLGDSVLGDFVLGAFVRIPSSSEDRMIVAGVVLA